MGPDGKFKALSTLQQKLSHINCLLEFHPPLNKGPPADLQQLAKGLGMLKTTHEKDHMLPPGFLIAMSKLQKPDQMQVAIQFQALTGLRGGQMSLLTPLDFAPSEGFWAAPCHIYVDHRHVPVWLIRAFVAFATSDYAPILPYTPTQYQQHFKSLTASYGLS